MDAVTALNRFGLGARPGDLARVAPDPRGALRAELKPDRALVSPEAVEAAGLAGTAGDMRAAFVAEAERRAQRESLKGIALPAILPSAMTGGSPPFKPQPFTEGLIFRAEAAARLAMARDAEIGFVERLVMFWSNHFCVSAGKAPLLRASAGAFEREAIRPHVLGRFADMLVAVERHPAMLFYLDNVRSVGPASRAGAKGKRGLNENLARETLELHTLGVGGGYTQADVTALARVITGWTFAGREGRIGEPGVFTFDAAWHEPGDQTVLGRVYPGGGFGQGEAALNDLARHPATARHVATKLVRHFVADDPPPAAVERIAAVFTERDGDLRAVASALVDLPEAWSAPMAKVRSPADLVIAVARLTGAPLRDPGPTLGALHTLGQPLWEPPGPNGYPDTAADWASPENMKLRLDLCAAAAHAYKGGTDPLALIEAAAGNALSPETRDAIPRAESREQGLALALMSPEFQRR
nr:DUF1800 family protein [Lichenibacterium sp. 6Y81]